MVPEFMPSTDHKSIADYHEKSKTCHASSGSHTAKYQIHRETTSLFLLRGSTLALVWCGFEFCQLSGPIHRILRISIAGFKLVLRRISIQNYLCSCELSQTQSMERHATSSKDPLLFQT